MKNVGLAKKKKTRLNIPSLYDRNENIYEKKHKKNATRQLLYVISTK